MVHRIPLVSKKLRIRLWIIIAVSTIFLVYSSLSGSFAHIWVKFGFTSGDKSILTIGMVVILLISMSGLVLVDKVSPSNNPFRGEKKGVDSSSEDPSVSEEDEVDYMSQYFNNMLLQLQKELSQVNENTKSLADANESLARLAVKDGLTDLYNQSYAKERLQQEIYRTERYKHSLSLLMIDIDDFKKLNDKYGHVTGDRVLKTIGRLILETIRPSDIPARYGGEEFLIILPETTSQNAGVVGERIREKIASYSFEIDPLKEETCRISISVGTSTFPDYGDSTVGLIKLADAALYKAKREGKNKVVVYSG